MTSSNGNIFRVTGPLCGEFTGPGEFPTQRPVTRSFDVYFDLPLNKRLSKQPWGWWFETLSWSLWRQCNVLTNFTTVMTSWHENAFRISGFLRGESRLTGGFPSQRANDTEILTFSLLIIRTWCSTNSLRFEKSSHSSEFTVMSLSFYSKPYDVANYFQNISAALQNVTVIRCVTQVHVSNLL